MCIILKPIIKSTIHCAKCLIVVESTEPLNQDMDLLTAVDVSVKLSANFLTLCLLVTSVKKNL